MSRIPKSAETRAFDEALGRNIVKARKTARMKCVDLAAAAGRTTGALYMYESGLNSCPPLTLLRIAAALGVPVDALLPEL